MIRPASHIAFSQIVRSRSIVLTVVSGLLAVPALSRAQSASTSPAAQKKPLITARYEKLPLSFEKNSGQADPRVKFVAHGEGYSLSLVPDGALLTLHKPARSNAGSEAQASPRVRLVGANSNPEIVGEQELAGKVNYLIGNDPKQWRTNLPTYGRVLYKSVYPGIDLAFYGNQGQLEFDFIVHPGADPRLIRLDEPGTERSKLDKSGNLVTDVTGGQIVFEKPLVYQRAEGERREIASNFVIQQEGRISFNVGKYDRSKPLVIDPPLVYSTYLGGNTGFLPNAIAVDSTGNAFVAGTVSLTYPVTPNAFQSTPGANTFPVLAKMNADGTGLIYATYFGGTGQRSGYSVDAIYGIAVDASDNTYLTGIAASLNFPTTPGAYQSASPCLPGNQFPASAGGPVSGLCSRSSAFVSELNPNGTALIYSTYLGGTTGWTAFSVLGNLELAIPPFPTTENTNNEITGELGTSIALDASGMIYIGGASSSSDLPVTATAPQTASIAESAELAASAFAAKFNPTAQGAASLVYSTYIGGLFSTEAFGIAVDSQGSAYVAGSTDSPRGFPTTTGAFQTSTDGNFSAGFVTKINPAGTAFAYSTLLGSAGVTNTFGDVNIFSVAVDSKGSAYVTGAISGNQAGTLPTTSESFQPSCNTLVNAPTSCSIDAFVTKFSPDGSSLAYSTYLGGPSEDVGLGITVDSDGHAYLVGVTGPELAAGVSDAFPVTPDAYQTGCSTVITSENLAECIPTGFVTEMSADGSSLVYSTYLGGNSTAVEPIGVALDPSDNIHVSGTVNGSNFPVTPGAFSSTFKPNIGGFLTKFGTAAGPVALTVQPNSIPDTAVGLGYSLTFTASGGAGAITWTETGALPGGITFSGGTLNGIPTQSGTFPLTITATDANGDTGSITSSLVILPATTASVSLTPCSPTAASIAALNFGSVNVGTGETKTYCINNTGDSTLYVQFTISFGPFYVSKVSTTCDILEGTPPNGTNGIAPGGSCQTVMSFAPTGAGLYNTDAVGITYNGGTIDLSFVGTGVTPPPTLSSIAVTPASPSITAGNTQQFAATGTYSDGSTKTITGSVTWTSATTSVATITSAGLATGVAAGTSQITATLSGITSPTDTLTVTAAGNSGGAPACFCDKAGNYAAPVAGVAPATGATSPNGGTYTLTTSGPGINLLIKKGNATVLNQSGLPVSSNWGFSPDGNRFVIYSVSGAVESVTLYDLTKSPASIIVNTNFSLGVAANGSSPSQVLFSPSGSYLLLESLSGASSSQFFIYSATTGVSKLIYESLSIPWTSASPADSSEDGFGMVSFGFSSDNPESTFLYAFVAGPTTVDWDLVSLAATNKVNKSGSINIGSTVGGYWLYSPCADILAVVQQQSQTLMEVTLWPASGGGVIADNSNITLGTPTLTSSATQQTVTVGSSSTVLVSNNCPPPPPSPVPVPDITATVSSIQTDASGNYIVNLAIGNTGTGAANGVALSGASLVATVSGKARTTATTTALPVSLGAIQAGGSANATVSFPASAGTANSAALVRLSLTFAGGSASPSLRATLP